MNQRDRIDRLEARLDTVEAELRNLLRAIEAARGEDREIVSKIAASTEPEPAARQGPATSAEATSPAPSVPDRPSPRSPRGERPTSAARRPSTPDGDLEAWFGEHGLLVVGVLALVAAVGFALKHAFDQGWISPAVRVLTGLIIGLGTAAYGERVQRRGLHQFGAAAVGAGAAIAYLAAWAAAGPYAFVAPGTGIAALAVLSGLVLASAWRSDEPYLAAMAAAGAYVAPFVLGDAATSADLLLVYVALVSGAVAIVAGRRGWRLTFAIVLAGFFGTAVLVTGRSDAAWFGGCVAAGGAAAIALSRGRGWGLHEVVAWTVPWLLLLVGADDPRGWRGWVYASVPALLVAPGWIVAVRSATGGDAGREDRPYRDWMLGAAALAWALAALAAVPRPGAGLPLLVAAVIALVYLVPGLTRRIPAAFAAGVGVLAIGVFQQWEGPAVTLAWAGLVGATALFARGEGLVSVRWIGLALGVVAGRRLFTGDLHARPDGELAFFGQWSLALYGLVAALVVLAAGQWTREDALEREAEGLDLRIVTWLAAGLLVLAGGTVEIMRLEISSLATGLTVSAFWLVYAGSLLAWGFRADSRAVRITGLAVAALAVLKVVFYDLAVLDALYRVGSFALLAAIALIGAHAYHGRSRDRDDGEAESGSPQSAG